MYQQDGPCSATIMTTLRYLPFDNVLLRDPMTATGRTARRHLPAAA
jgi:uracil phosphoribosyltransferase